MCKVYNQVGSLITIKNHLREHNIDEFKSVKQVIGFQESYATVRQQIISDHILLIEQEKSMLSVELPQLDESIRIKRNEVEQKLLSEQEHQHRMVYDYYLERCSDRDEQYFLVRNYAPVMQIRVELCSISDF